MRAWSIFASVVFAMGVSAIPAAAQRPENATAEVLPPAPTMTPELWMYLREQQKANDPKEYRRRVAMEKAAHRRARLEMQRWYGYSASRPIASPMPFEGTYSPMWVGSGANGFLWSTGSSWPLPSRSSSLYFR